MNVHVITYICLLTNTWMSWKAEYKTILRIVTITWSMNVDSIHPTTYFFESVKVERNLIRIIKDQAVRISSKGNLIPYIFLF